MTPFSTTSDQKVAVYRIAAEMAESGQPSLSRFFNTSSMPRRTTLYRIADALQLSEDQIISQWVA